MKKSTVWILLIGTPLLWFTWDMPVGYYQFKHACEAEGGLKVFEKPETAVQLRITPGLDKVEAEYMLGKFRSLKVIEAQDLADGLNKYYLFSLDENGKLKKQPTNDNFQANYILSKERGTQGIRLEKTRFVLKRNTSQEVAAYTSFYFEISNPNHTLLGRSGGPSCFQYGGGNPLPEMQLVALVVK